GKVFNEAGEIKLLTPDLNIENEDVVDKITGATGTSGRFNVLLNENYKEKMGSIVNIDLEEVAIYRWKSTILTHNDIEFTRTNYAEIFEAEFDKLLNTEVEKEDVFLHKTLKTYSYFYSG